MIRNNLISFIIHICIVLLNIYILFVNGLTTPWLSLLTSLFYVFLYFFTGTRLSPQKNKLMNFFSVMLIGIVGVLIWGLALMGVAEPSEGLLKIGFFTYLTLAYVSNLSGFLFLIKGIGIGEFAGYVLFLISFFIPSILLWLGLNYRGSRDRRIES